LKVQKKRILERSNQLIFQTALIAFLTKSENKVFAAKVKSHESNKVSI